MTAVASHVASQNGTRTTNAPRTDEVVHRHALAHGHTVNFYESDDALTETVAAFLSAGLSAEENLLVVATETHRQAFRNALGSRGHDVEGLIASGRLTMLDADTTLTRFLVNGVPDPRLFAETIGSVLDQIASRGAPGIRVYGEMVDLLWQRGSKSAALALEELWTLLQRSHSFSLLCAYAISGFAHEASGLSLVSDTHTSVTGSGSVPLPGVSLPSDIPGLTQLRHLSAEIAKRKELEASLRSALQELRENEAALRGSQQELSAFVENATIGLHWAAADGTILWANRAELELLGYEQHEYVGRHIADFHDDPAVAADLLDRLLKFEEIRDYEVRLRAKDGSIRHVLISSNAYAPDGQFRHTCCFTRDVSTQKRLERVSDSVRRREDRLTRVTTAIAQAVTAEEVYDAVVDQVAVALEASSGGLWLLDEDGRRANLVRSLRYDDAAKPSLDGVAIDGPHRLPVTDVLRTGRPLWLESRQHLLAEYPELRPLVSASRNYSVCCLPITVDGATIGALAFTFEGAPPLEDEERSFLLLVSRYSAQAIARLRMLDIERRLRTEAEDMATLAGAVIRAGGASEVFSAALDAIEHTIGTTRSAILVTDPDGVMRFKAWRGLSDDYRRAVEGHSPWPRDARNPQPVIIPDVHQDAALAGFMPLFLNERIAALGFIPLVAGERLIGKFMVYFESPRDLTAAELTSAGAIADHVAAAINRFAAIEALEHTVRFNEMFAGILGHDLRNPLSAIMTAAQVVLRRGDTEKVGKPVSRILTSGGRMARMIDQLLDFTRVRVGTGMPIDPRPVDLRPVLSQVMEELEDANPEWTLRLEADGADTFGQWDADRLSQVFSNLLANAVQHGIAEDGVRVRVTGDSEWVRIEIRNGGVIDAALVPHLFEPMTGAQRRRERSQGLGLGLHISLEIVRAHAGSIAVESSEALGTVFTVTLPRATQVATNHS